MTRRLLTLVALAVLAAAGLTACRSNVGVAATVDGHEVSETQVNDYVSRGGVDPSLSAQAHASGQDIIPKVTALQVLITEQVFEDTLRDHGGVPSAGSLSDSHDEAAQVLGQAQQTSTPLVGSAYDKSLRTQFVKAGLSTSLLPRYLRLQELELTLIKRLKLANDTALLAATRKAAHRVSVNPRYGTWDPANLTVAKAANPAYLHLQSAGSSQNAAPTSP